MHQKTIPFAFYTRVLALRCFFICKKKKCFLKAGGEPWINVFPDHLLLLTVLTSINNTVALPGKKLNVALTRALNSRSSSRGGTN